MYTIYLDTTIRFQNKILLLKDGNVLEESVGEFDVISEIQRLLNKNNIKISDISDVQVNEGPGSFTGIKVGITIANILNWVLKKDNVKKIYEPKYGSEPNIFKTPWIE